MKLNSKQQKTLESIFETPVSSSILWSDIIRLFKALGGTITQGRGSRVRVQLNGRRAVFHEPHPERETDKGAVKSVKEFLEDAGFEAEGDEVENVELQGVSGTNRS